MTKKIICSAIKMSNGEIIRGHRHHDCIRTARNIPRLKELQIFEQGFMTSENEFVGRKEAREIAFHAGQIANNTTHNDLLFSEDLY